MSMNASDAYSWADSHVYAWDERTGAKAIRQKEMKEMKKLETEAKLMTQKNTAYSREDEYKEMTKACPSKVEPVDQMTYEECLQDAADELARRTLWDVHELASELFSKRLLEMSVEELDASKKTAFEKNEAEMRLKEVSIDAREARVAAVEQEQACREEDLQEELQLLKEETSRARATLTDLRVNIGNEKIEYATMVKNLKEALVRVQNLELEYTELQNKASSFVDDSLLKYFEGKDDVDS